MRSSLLKKSLMVFTAFIVVISSFSLTAFAKEKTTEEIIKEGETKTAIVNTLVDKILIGGIANAVPNMRYIRDDSIPLSTENFYLGDTDFIESSDKYEWKMGYGRQSIIPDDFGVPFKYARGSYVPWFYATDYYTDDEGNKETMNVRTILLDDNTGRGSVLICSVDCIGISNTDVLKIRNGLKDFAEKYNVKSINISAVHSHMAIDSQGVWGHPLSTIMHNLVTGMFSDTAKSGVEKDYLDKIISSTLKSAQEAADNMKSGSLTYTDIELHDYTGTRTNSHECDQNIHKIMFYPNDNSKATVIASFGVHPELTSYGHETDSRLSSDFIYYMEKLVNKAGYNFMFLQGNVGTNGVWTGSPNDGLPLETPHDECMRYGYEMAYITLTASMVTAERIIYNDELGDMLGINKYSDNDGYTIWYDGLGTFEERKIEAFLNIRHRQVKFVIDNSTSLALLKLGIASNDISYNKKDGKYYNTTEIGYMELGSVVKAFLCPGEMYSELYVGGYGLRNSSYKSLREDYGEDVILFDLMNDAAGYICPDETYTLIGYKYDPTSNSLVDDTWCLAVSIGSKTASTIMNAYSLLIEEIS